MKNVLYITETINPDETTTIAYEVEAQSGTLVATGSELLHDGGNEEIRRPLRAACVGGLEQRFNAERYVDFPPEGVMLPRSEDIGPLTRGDDY